MQWEKYKILNVHQVTSNNTLLKDTLKILIFSITRLSGNCMLVLHLNHTTNFPYSVGKIGCKNNTLNINLSQIYLVHINKNLMY